EHRHHPLDPVVDDLVENVALVLEVPVEGPVTDPELLGDIGDPGGAVTASREHLVGSLDDLRTAALDELLGRRTPTPAAGRVALLGGDRCAFHDRGQRYVMPPPRPHVFAHRLARFAQAAT